MPAARGTMVIGSRSSRLALRQTEWVRERLREAHAGLAITVKEIATTGDASADLPVSQIGGKGVFTREIEQALLDGEIDAAVHSLKDLPTTLPEGLAIGAVTRREDVRDAFIPHPASKRRTIAELPAGSVVAAGSPRRRAQILHWSKGFRLADIRGNVPTRFRKLEQSDWAGMILARAGVVRLGLDAAIGETLEPEVMLPAPGQGALAIEIRSDDRAAQAVVEAAASDAAALCTRAERAFLRRLEGGCSVPVGAWGRIADGRLLLDGLVASLDGTRVYRGRTSGGFEEADELGSALAETLLGSGAAAALATAGETPQ